MKILAHMLCRNEVDVIEEAVREIFRWTNALFVVDGASTDGTLEALQDLAEVYRAMGATFVIHSRPDEQSRFLGQYRQELLELMRPHMMAGDWVLSVDADEIYDSYYDHNGNEINPITAIRVADAAGANVVRCWVPQFWLTFQDVRDGALHEDEKRSIQERRRWYSWGWMGTFIWKWNDAHYYPIDISKRTPELPGQTWRQWQIAGPAMPICKHYCIRSLAQGLTRTQERLARGGTFYFGKYGSPYSLLIDEQIAGLRLLGEDKQWNTEPTHDRLNRWFANGGKEQGKTESSL